jgi:hypothetical protein
MNPRNRDLKTILSLKPPLLSLKPFSENILRQLRVHMIPTRLTVTHPQRAQLTHTIREAVTMTLHLRNLQKLALFRLKVLKLNNVENKTLIPFTVKIIPLPNLPKSLSLKRRLVEEQFIKPIKTLHLRPSM